MTDTLATGLLAKWKSYSLVVCGLVFIGILSCAAAWTPQMYIHGVSPLVVSMQ